MSNQVDGVIELKPEKAEKPAKAAAEKPAKDKASKDQADKPAKDKAPKTAYAGRLEEIAVKGDGSLGLTLKDKRGKAHDFVLSGNLASTVTAQLLSAAITGKLKLHVNTSPENLKQVAGLSLHAKK